MFMPDMHHTALFWVELQKPFSGPLLEIIQIQLELGTVVEFTYYIPDYGILVVRKLSIHAINDWSKPYDANL